MPPLPPPHRVLPLAAFSLVVFMVLGLYAYTLYAQQPVAIQPTVVVTPTVIITPLPPTATPPPGLAALAANASMRIGVAVEEFLLVHPDRTVESNQIAADFNSITPGAFFGTIHRCPPRALVDRHSPTYNSTVHRIAQQSHHCDNYLVYGNPATVDWATYEAKIEWNWTYYDKAVRWAKARGIGVHFQTLFWEHSVTSVLPNWLQLANVPSDLLNDPEQRHSLAQAFLLTMEAHANGVALHLCQTPDLRDTVYAYDVLNEVTNSDGSLRGWQHDPLTNPYPFGWALINELATNDPDYTGPASAYYIYKAFQLADRAITTHCAKQTPRPQLIFNDKFPIHVMWDSPPDNPNLWARGAYDTIVAINRVEPGLIDGVGIQAHLNLQPTAKIQGDPVGGLRSILEAFDAAGVKIHITELDVAIRQADYYSFFDPSEIARFFPQQARVYRNVAHACLYADETYDVYAPLCESIATWGLYDHESWLDCFHPLLFNEGTPLAPRPNNPFCPLPVSDIHPLPTPTPWVPPRVPTALVPKLGYHAFYNELRTIPNRE
jgi:GH35 family endo-1,4-beta-xylanase